MIIYTQKKKMSQTQNVDKIQLLEAMKGEITA